ncbi:MAG: HAMP domain-containing histidine kinase [Roseitalea sp.]|jgi:signal transduction histidine kinase|nr:HAMP domain-containing histidine kinase [Roseitalea sp.]MBO6722513.1 HAMP domain-containing histidine kinase [Roseitalea sp.]MBO6742943.1 HAMP domain-containing histidine kinase [Roseitalea sp.]
MSETGEHSETAPAPAMRPRRRLSAKLLWLTILFVMIAEILIFVPSVANFRITWLEQRLNTAAAASVLITAEAAAELPQRVQDDVLMAIGAKTIALRMEGQSRLLVVSGMPEAIDQHVDVARFTPAEAIRDAFATLLFGGDQTLRVTGPIGDSDGRIELVMPDDYLREAMLTYARNVAILSLLISLITATLVFLAINRIMIRPIEKMTASMLRFAANPSDPRAVIAPENRSDELGIAERELSGMQSQLQSTLRSQKRLADLGLAVSKINHDMRNILASAQLISDRLAETTDPTVQRFAPKLVRAIDRAAAYTSDVVSYGKAQEKEPARRRVRLGQVIGDVEELLGLEPGDAVQFSANVPDDLEIDADPEQLFRVTMNLCRNAVQAMRGDDDPATVKRVSVSAVRMGTTTIISIEDTGPGLPPKAREHLFAPFAGAARQGGTGLGLAIAHELVTAHGGTLELRDDRAVGTHFEIRLPDAPVRLSGHARQAPPGTRETAGGETVAGRR